MKPSLLKIMVIFMALFASVAFGITTSAQKMTNKVHTAAVRQATNITMNFVRLATNANTMIATNGAKTYTRASTNVVMNYVRSATNVSHTKLTNQIMPRVQSMSNSLYVRDTALTNASHTGLTNFLMPIISGKSNNLRLFFIAGTNAGRVGITAQMTALSNYLHYIFRSEMSNRFTVYSNAHP